MKRFSLGLLAAAATISFAPAAMAASDYFLHIEGVEGEAAAAIEVNSWSWGASNAGAVTSPRDAASGMATGRHHGHPSVTASQNTQSLRESPTRRSTGQTAARVSSAANPDMMTPAALDEIQGFSLTFDKASPVLAKVCAGKHIASAQLRGRGETFVLENTVVTGCAAPAAASGPRQTQGATFGERCVAGVCATGGAVTLTITGQMKHTKTGHVTLLK